MAKNIRQIALDTLLILLGGISFAVGFALFLEPYQINGGGVAGLAMVFCGSEGEHDDSQARAAL